MLKQQEIVIAAKCAPDEAILGSVEDAGIRAVELYTSSSHLSRLDDAERICSRFPFRYAIHAPNDGENWNPLAEMVSSLKAEVVIIHNVYWEDEWERILRKFEGMQVKLCMENTFSVLEPVRFMKRYGIGMCMDMEHLQIECAGFFEEGASPFIRMASHIHLTGYTFGSDMWHTHLHHSPEHNLRLLDAVQRTGFSGMIVSEAKTSLQTLSEFQELYRFAEVWQERNKKHTIISEVPDGI
jgi:hypothetical protein